MHIRRIQAVALTTCAIFAITAVADFSTPSGYGFGTVASAQAGNGNGNGGGNGGGHGGGNGGGNAGGHGKGGGVSAENRGNGNGRGNGNSGLFGKSGGLMGALTGKSKSSSRKSGQSLFGNLGLGFGRDKTRTASTGKRSSKSRAAKVNLASVPVPSAKPVKEKNFNAKLAGLNSLNRNYHAYMNAQDPRMAAIRSYVLASIDYEDATATLDEALSKLGLAEENFANSVASLYDGLTTYDGFSLAEPDVASLESRLTDLENLDTTEMSEDEVAAIQAEIDAINDALSSTEADSLQAMKDNVDDAQKSVDELADQVTDESLKEALLDAANKNRVEEYGVENYVDEEMLDWAKDLLGVDDSYGKIDQVREAIESEEAASAADGAESEDTATEEIDS